MYNSDFLTLPVFWEEVCVILKSVKVLYVILKAVKTPFKEFKKRKKMNMYY